MMDGHFVWIWIDSAQNTSFKNATEEAKDVAGEGERRSERSVRSERDTRNAHRESVLSDMHLHYFLKNDPFLLFNRHDGVESSKLKKSSEIFDGESHANARKAFGADTNYELPVGLLSLRPLPIRIDRHLVKGAVKLLVATLKVILDDCPDWLLDSIALGELKTSCWKELGKEELNFSTLFAR